ncbi:MAG: FAD-dependent oxidoreductase [Clostridia bacterium]|nr:FAD-dependent oxidoreductase [Clostridia bacterium]
MKSIWWEGVELSRFPTLKQDINTDVLIIGGGMAGVLTAYLLSQQGVDCVLVEKERIGGGVTGNTTAKVTAQHGLIYNQIAQDYGLDAAKVYLQANLQALERYAALADTIPCDWERQDNFVYAVNDRQKLEDEYRTLDKLGYPATLCDTVPLPLKTVGAVCFPRQAQFHPLKFLAGIAQGLRIYENTFVREMVGNWAITDSGTVRANTVVVVTHFPFLNKHGSYFLKLYQHRSYVLALENVPSIKGMYVDKCQTGLSFRGYGDHLLLGGGGHRTGKNGGNWSELRAFAAEHYPRARETHHWAAQDCMSLDGIPYIGQYSKRTHELYTAGGFNKWGMTGAMLSAMLLCDRITKKDNPWASVFDPSRSMLKPQLLVNGLESTVGLLTPFSKRCPHLGCALKWNPAEHSWDCPCHGSRFSKDGKLLDNPANGDLKRV